MDMLVSTEWLEAELGAADLRILDATWFLPSDGRDARAEYEAGHVPGAAFADIDEVSDPDTSLPHMLPPAHIMASRMQALGVADGSRIIVYDNSPLHSAARLWWMLRSFGARRVALLDGGLAKWTAEGRPLEAGPARPRRGHFTPLPAPGAAIGKAELLGLVGAGEAEIVDARGAGRFAGDEPEPRPGLSAGHIPGAKNLPQGQLFDADNRWKRDDALRAAFEAAGVDLARPMVTTCGSGVTAAVLLFGAQLLGKEDVRLYDGSWSEWGADPALPKSKGRA
jgi:thiosulfate/3-mercaptopyruvate sulfurtransferase